jgi:hypothetical protein
LPAGRHEVVMMYRPKILSVGLALMVVGLVVMVAYASAGRVTVRFGGSRLRPRRDAGC